MAGIGFELRKLYQDRSDLSKLAGSIQGAIASSGPWLLSMSMLLGIHQLISPLMASRDYEILLVLYVYLFTFSLLVSSAPSNMVTRAIADAIYLNDLKKVPDYLLSSTLLVGIPSFWIAFGFLQFQPHLRHLALDGAWLFSALSTLWVVMAFSSALKDYKATSINFGLGLILGLILMYFFSAGSLTLVLRFYTFALILPLFALLGILFQEFGLPQSFDISWVLNPSYWPLFFSGLFLNLGIWADKLIYWQFSSHGIAIIDGLKVFPAYDMAAFLSNLLLIPAFTFFIIFVETDFATAQHRYLNVIESRRGLDEIEQQRKSLTEAFFGCMTRLLLFQVMLSLVGSITFPALLSMADTALPSAPLLRLSLLNILIQLLIQTLCIFLYYFDCQKEVLFISFVLFVLNTGLSWIFRDAPFRFTGLTYFASLMVSMQLAIMISWRKLRLINYYTFTQSDV